jgi:hypothetical protein
MDGRRSRRKFGIGASLALRTPFLVMMISSPRSAASTRGEMRLARGD